MSSMTLEIEEGEWAYCPNCGGSGDDEETMICVMCGGDGKLGDFEEDE